MAAAMTIRFEVMTTPEPPTREIKSYVRRAGRITPSQKTALKRYWPEYGIEFDTTSLQLPTDYTALKLEIGIGNGDALIEMARSDPGSLYLGVEVHEPGIGRCLNHIVRHGLENVRLIRHDAIEVLRHMVPPGSVDRILLFFPDPWHKKRHHKRRIVNARFRDLVFRALKPGGVIHVATDWQDYAEWIAQQFLGDDRFENEGDAAGYCERPLYRPQTRFELRGRRLGHGVWDLMFAKRSDSSSPA
jgi:tRNA (guanine-N7-)-methyltransferase